MSDIFEHKSQSAKALASIDSSKYPDTNKDFEANMQRLNVFVDYMASYMGEMQKGIDDANRDIFQQIQDFISDVVILFGGGDITNGMDLGDLQYFLPAIGALLGFDADTPFPINLFQAAEHLLLGYIVPLDAFTTVVEDIVNGFLGFLGVDQDFIDAVDALVQALMGIGGEFATILEDIFGFFDDILGIFGLGGSGIVGDIWHALTMLFSGNPLKGLVDLIDPVLHILAPWIKELADIVEFFLAIVHGVVGTFATVGDAIVAFVSFIWNLFAGLLRPGQTTTTPAGGVSAVDENLILEPDFAESVTVFDDAGDWSWDETVGFPDPGCVKATANGTLIELISNEVKVAQKQKYDLYCYVSWDGIEYSDSDPIVMGVTLYYQGEDVGSVDLDTIAYPASAGTWTKLSGTFNVPVLEQLPVDSMRMRLKVGANMVFGTVWWDAVSMKNVDTGTSDNILNKLFGWLGLGYSHDEEADALEAQANALLYQSSQLAKVWAILSANPVIVDDFERTPTQSLGSNWDEIYTSTGSWSLNGHQAYWDQPIPALGHGFGMCLWVGANANSVTDFQTNICIMAGAPKSEFDWWWFHGVNYIIGRSNTDGRYRIQFTWRADKHWTLDKVIDGNVVNMSNGILTNLPGSASRVALICGDKPANIVRHYTVIIDGQVICSDDFGDRDSAYGTQYRRRGFAGYYDGQPLDLTTGARPGSVDDFIGMDTD